MQGIHGDHVAGAGVLHLVAPLADAVANPFASVWQREAPNLAGRGIYRLARDPNNSDRLVAATDIGLFTRTGPFQQDRPWSRVKTGPLDFDADDDKWTTDVLWTAAGRLFVGLIDDTRFSDTGVYISTHGTDGPFNKVDLDGINDPRKIRIGLAVAPNDFNRVYVLSSGPKLWRIDGTSGRRIRRVPKLLFGTGDQSEYQPGHRGGPQGFQPDRPRRCRVRYTESRRNGRAAVPVQRSSTRQRPGSRFFGRQPTHPD